MGNIISGQQNLDFASFPRNVGPTHYTLKVESFSRIARILLNTNEHEYQSDTFEAGGHKWKLSLYTNGDRKRNAEGYVSLYLVIAEPETLPLGWQVEVDFKLCVFNQIQDNYLTLQDFSVVSRFHAMKTRWGFPRLLPRDVLEDTSKGYLINDTCIFGAEVFVINSTGNGECLSLFKQPHPELEEVDFFWKIEKFSCLDDSKYTSDLFMVQNHKWKLELYPKGDSRANGKSLSLFLQLDDCNGKRKVYADYIICIRDQSNGNHTRNKGQCWFWPGQGNGWGRSHFLSLTDLKDVSKGYLLNDTLIIDCRFLALTTMRKFLLGYIEKDRF